MSIKKCMNFLPEWYRLVPETARNSAIELALRSSAGPSLRTEIGKLIVEKLVPVGAIVPEFYSQWREPVREAMCFVVSQLSPVRLAAKIVEQIDMPANAPPELRLLQLIAKVPGLQKLGQVIARNRHLRTSLKTALIELENGIHDMTAEEVCTIIRRELASRLDVYGVEIEPKILSEASVSAVVRFTWHNPETGQYERGVFKVLKPHIPDCFAEDMEILQKLASFFGARHAQFGMAVHAIPDTFTKVRRLLQHEVDFPGEQAALLKASALYRSMPGIRVPRLIKPLCTPNVTAITEEAGAKVVDAVADMPSSYRCRVAEQLIEALVAVPLLTPERSAMFHADPHAGNLLYDTHSGQLVVLDWALKEQLSLERRRHLALLMLMTALRDPIGASTQIQHLSEHRIVPHSRRAQLVQDTIAGFLDELPVTTLPGMVDTMRLLERVAIAGIRFPAPLIMFSKMLFTLDGVLHDVGGSGTSMFLVMARHLASRWRIGRDTFTFPLTARDWLAIQGSAVLGVARLGVRIEQEILKRLLPQSDSCAAEAA